MTQAPSAPAALRPAGLVLLLLGQVMATMDGSIVNVALDTIRRDLDASDAAIQLVVAGYIFTLGVLVVTGARVGDLIGHRRAFLLGLAGFTAASLLCGLAPSAPVLVAGRIVQGAAGALMVPQVLALIQLGRGGAARARAIAWYSLVLALGVALGQVVGGVIVGADLGGLAWRPVFLVNVPIGVVQLMLGARLLPPAPPGERPRLDLVGVALLTSGLGAVMVPLVFAPKADGAAWTWPPAVVGALTLGWFLAHERRHPAPLFDFAVLRPPGVTSGIAACITIMGCYTAFLFALTLHLQGGLGYTPLRAGLTFLPYALGFAAVSLSWRRLGAAAQSRATVIGPAAFAAGVGGVLWLAADGWPAVPGAGLLFLAGCGHAAGYSPLIARLAARVESRHASALSALNSAGPQLAGVTAVAGLGSVFLAAADTAAGLRTCLALIVVLLALTAAAAQRSRVSATR